MDSKTIMTEAEELLMKTYNRFKIVLDHGDGVYLYDNDGKAYLDFGSGIGVFALGYNNKEYNDALKAQIDKLIHTSNLFYNEPALKAAKALAKASGMDRVFFTNSGTEAVEGAVKLARKYYYKKKGEAYSEIIAFEHSFHGRSMGALSVTGTKHYREPFEPLVGGVKWAEYNNIDSVLANISDKTAAIIMETVQGEGGIYPADKDFIKKVREVCDEKDIVLILDEIQCGMGRTGTMYAYEQFGIKPDIVTSAKALACGVPFGAFAAMEKVAAAFEPGDHGTTYGGNPFACAASAKVFELFEKQNVLENVKETGAYLSAKLDELAAKYPVIVAHRGLGLMQGLQIDTQVPVGSLVNKCIEKGMLVLSAGGNVLRLLPPLVIGKGDVDKAISIIEEVLKEI